MKILFLGPLALSAPVLLVTVISAAAQSFTLDHSALGGGGPGAGTRFVLDGASGQPDADLPSEAGRFSLTGGFTSLAAGPASAAPRLAIEHVGTDVRIAWPLVSSGFVLDHSFSPEGPWLPVSLPRETNAINLSVSVPLAEGNAFYRLRQP